MAMHRSLAALSRSKRGWLVCLTAGLVLFAQVAMAAQSCMLMRAAPEPASVAMAECDGVPMDNGACVARCLAGDQPSAPTDHQTPVLSFPSVAPLAFAFADSRAASAHTTAMDVPRGPPPRILFCSYRT